MAARVQTNRTVERLEANRQYLQHLADACGEEAGLHKPLAETVGGVVRSTSDTLVHLLDQNREQVEHALQRVREGAYGMCESCGHRIPQERLRYQHSATRCVECQSQWDLTNGRTA